MSDVDWVYRQGMYPLALNLLPGQAQVVKASHLPGQSGYMGQLGAVLLDQTVSRRALVRTRFPLDCSVNAQGPWVLDVPLCHKEVKR